MTTPSARLFLLVALGLASAPSSAADPVDPAALKACAKMADSGARLACFDRLGERLLADESADETSPPEPAVPPVPVIEDEPRPVEAQNHVLITSCKQGLDRKWSFYLDNGQIWKQTNSQILRFRECNLSATILKDSFGYKMRIERPKASIRVTRKR